MSPRGPLRAQAGALALVLAAAVALAGCGPEGGGQPGASAHSRPSPEASTTDGSSGPAASPTPLEAADAAEIGDLLDEVEQALGGIAADMSAGDAAAAEGDEP